MTRGSAQALFDEGHAGLVCWSLEASSSNVTLFAERATGMLVLAEEPEGLSVRHWILGTAAEAIGGIRPTNGAV